MEAIRFGSAGTPDEGGPADPGLAELLQRSARGDEAAFARLYDLTAAKVYGLALRVVRNPALAEEVTQETYIDVWRSASRYEAGRGSVLTWMLTVTHRRAVDRVRASESAVRRESTYGGRNHTINHDTTAEAAHAALEAKRVRAALATLTPVQREAVELAYLSGYTHTEVAGMLDLPVGTAKTRIRDGLIRLRDVMGVGERQ